MWVMGLGAVGYGVMEIWDVDYGVMGCGIWGYGVVGCGIRGCGDMGCGFWGYGLWDMGLWGYGLWGYGLWGTPRSLPVPPSPSQSDWPGRGPSHTRGSRPASPAASLTALINHEPPQLTTDAGGAAPHSAAPPHTDAAPQRRGMGWMGGGGNGTPKPTPQLIAWTPYGAVGSHMGRLDPIGGYLDPI